MGIKSITVLVVMATILCDVEGQKIDSLKPLLHGKEGFEKINILFELASQHLHAGNNLAAVQFALEGYRIARNFNDSLMTVENGRIAANALRLQGKVDSAINFYESIIPLNKGRENSSQHLSILNGLALAYTYTAKYDKALNLHFQYVEAKRRNNDAAGVAIGLNNIGLVYYKLKDYRKGKEFFTKAIQLKKELNDDYDLRSAFLNLSLCHAYLGDFFNAKLNISRALQTGSNNISDYETACADFAMGVIYFGLKDYRNAEKYCLKSYHLSAKNRDIRFQFDNIDYLTQIYLAQGRIDNASYYLRKAEALINMGEPYNLEMIKIYARFFEMYNQVKNYEKAYFYQAKYIQLKDSVYNEELTTNLMKVEADYMMRESQAKIAAQEQILLLKQNVISRQRVLNFTVGILIFFAIGFAMLLWKNYTEKKKSNVVLRENLRERTKELARNSMTLKRRLIAQNTEIKSALSNIRNSACVIQGLCLLSLKDVPDPIAHTYIDKQLDAIKHLIAQLDSLLELDAV